MHLQQPLFRTNEYPDLDYIPNYPWAGVLDTQNKLVHHPDLDRSPRSQEAHHDLWNSRLEGTTGLGEFVAIDGERNNDEPQWQSHRYVNATLVDHGIESGEDSSR